MRGHLNSKRFYLLVLLIGEAIFILIKQNFVFAFHVTRGLGGGLRSTEMLSRRAHVSGDTAETQNASAPPTKTRVVVVGGGIGGLSTAFDAKHYLHCQDQEVEVVVVSNREQFQFTPSNPWVATAKREPHEISLSLREVLPKHSMEFVYGSVEKLDPKERKITIRLGKSEEGGKKKDGNAYRVQEHSYDYLVIATGPRFGYEEIKGASLNKNVYSICTTPHAVETLHKFRETFNKDTSNPPGVLVAATQGASCFGPAYEYLFMVHHELEKIYGKGKTPPVTMVTSEPYVGHLGLGGAGNSEQVLAQLLKKHNITALTNCRIARVDDDAVQVEEIGVDGKVDRKITVPSQFNIMIPPFRGMDVWKQVPGLTDEHGMIQVDEFQQSPEYPNIFGVGICIKYPESVTTSLHMDDARIPIGIPKTGYAIESMGTAAVHNIQTMITASARDHNSDPSSSHRNMKKHNQEFVEPTLNGLCITDFGHKGEGAVFVTVPQFTRKRMYDVTIQGRVATMAKLAFEKYFLYKIDHGDTDPYYEKYLLALVGIGRIVTKPPQRRLLSLVTTEDDD